MYFAGGLALLAAGAVGLGVVVGFGDSATSPVRTPSGASDSGLALERMEGEMSALRAKMSALEDRVARMPRAEHFARALDLEAVARASASAVAAQNERLDEMAERLALSHGQGTALGLALVHLHEARAAGRGFELHARLIGRLLPDDPAFPELIDVSRMGVPIASELAGRLPGLIQAVREREALSRGGFWGWLEFYFRRLVRIRPVGLGSGVDASARAARMEVFLRRGQLDAALGEGRGISGPAREVFVPFLGDLGRAARLEGLIGDLDRRITSRLAESAESAAAAEDARP